ncbi:MAG: hypothetical protein ACRETS_08915, partial [Steroidobacteraceae bacterium]
ALIAPGAIMAEPAAGGEGAHAAARHACARQARRLSSAITFRSAPMNKKLQRVVSVVIVVLACAVSRVDPLSVPPRPSS